MKKPPNPYHRHRLPADLIRHAVCLSYLFSLSFRAVELLLAERGVIPILVQSRRDSIAAKCFFKRLLKGPQYALRVLIADKLKSSGVAKREVLPDVEHRESRTLKTPALDHPITIKPNPGRVIVILGERVIAARARRSPCARQAIHLCRT